MFEKYRDLVKASYTEKLTGKDISINMINPSPARLRKECLRVYANRREQHDLKLINQFFGPPDDNGNYDRAINKVEISRLKPLRTFMLSSTNPEPVIVELLAWLIDYPVRPFNFETFVDPDFPTLPPPPPTDPEPPSTDGGPQQPKEPDENETKNPWWKEHPRRLIIIILGGFAASTLISYMVWNLIIAQPQQCMIWSKDHYEQVDCHRKFYLKHSLALDTLLSNNFKMITKPDTLTANSVGKVYYLKVDNKPQCFTGPGKHPILNKDLKPITLYMIRKYFGVNPISVNNSSNQK
jgi:hypothetical protein